METAVAMARMAVADGITHTVCTPHMTPRIYENSIATIRASVEQFRVVLANREINLSLLVGADVHLTQDLKAKLDQGAIPTLGRSRHFLLEPPHNVLPPRLHETVADLLAAGYVPIITHPERLSWIENHYKMICGLARIGALIQLTASSVIGAFGKRPKYWSDRLLEEGFVDIIATDAHNTKSRPPNLSRARDEIGARFGDEVANNMVLLTPGAVLANTQVPPRLAPGVGGTFGNTKSRGGFSRWFGLGKTADRKAGKDK